MNKRGFYFEDKLSVSLNLQCKVCWLPCNITLIFLGLQEKFENKIRV